MHRETDTRIVRRELGRCRQGFRFQPSQRFPGRSPMRNVLGIMLSLVAGLSISQAAAVPLGNPGALKLAMKEGGLTEKVHCVPGWYHHSYGDGCYGGGYYGGGYYRGYRGVYRGGVYRGVYRGGVY